MRKTQLVMIWILPLILIGGLFYPLLGYMVLVMMIFFLTLSFFKGRFWCWNLCPRGAFLDLVLSKFSLDRLLPKVFTRSWFRWLVVVLFISFLIFRLIKANSDIYVIGSVFVGMCILTTILSIILGIITKHRGWCIICPMGTLQDATSRIGSKKNNK